MGVPAVELYGYGLGRQVGFVDEFEEAVLELRADDLAWAMAREALVSSVSRLRPLAR